MDESEWSHGTRLRKEEASIEDSDAREKESGNIDDPQCIIEAER